MSRRTDLGKEVQKVARVPGEPETSLLLTAWYFKAQADVR